MEQWRANWIERRIGRAATARTIVVGALRRTVFGLWNGQYIMQCMW